MRPPTAFQDNQRKSDEVQGYLTGQRSTDSVRGGEKKAEQDLNHLQVSAAFLSPDFSG